MTPISAPGTAKPRKRANGFTLVELLIVLAIMGLLSAAVVVALPDPRGSVMAEAERFAARARAAQERAIVDARAVSVRVDTQGYGFEVRRNQEWEALAREPLGETQWGEGIVPSLGGTGAARIVFDPTGLADPAELVLQRGAERASVAIEASGRIDVRS